MTDHDLTALAEAVGVLKPDEPPITAHDNYRAEIKNLISIYEPGVGAGLIPREYVDALHNALDVTEKRPACR